MAQLLGLKTWLTTLYRCSPAERVSHFDFQLDDLENTVRTCWENLDQEIIDKSIDNWRYKLMAVV